MLHTAVMAKDVKKTTDRHKPAKMVRIRGRIAAEAQKIADQNLTSLTEEVNRLVREGLAREGRWPPPDAKPR